MPLVSCDYLFITPRGVFRRDELEEDELEGALTVLVVYCGHTRSIFAHAVPKKGKDEAGYIVEQLKQDVLWLGHARVVIKSDNEPALLQVVQATIAALKISGVQSATDEGSVPYDPQTNGAAESAVKLLKGTVRANVLGLERQIQARVPVDHPVMSWLVRYSAMIRTLRVKGQDGLTAQQRVRGSSTIIRLIQFGEICRYKARSHESGIAGTPWRWSTGVWLGIDRRTGQYIVYDKDLGGIRPARTILRMPRPQQWSLDQVKSIAATPWSIHEPTVPEVIYHKPGEEQPMLDKVAQIRRVYIRQADLDTYGYTQGCKRCQHILVYGANKGTMPHSDVCRARIMEEMSKHATGRARLEKLNERTDKYLAEHLRKNAEGEPAPAQGRMEDNVPKQAPPLDFAPLAPDVSAHGFGHDAPTIEAPPHNTSIGSGHEMHIPSSGPGHEELGQRTGERGGGQQASHDHRPGHR